MFTNSTKIQGTLFTIAKEKRKNNGPVMDGQFQVEGESGKMSGAAWTKESKNGAPYLSLQIELDRQTKYYGALFATKDKKSDKAPDYFGTLNLGKTEEDGHLRIAGWKRRGKENGTPFISVMIEPAQPLGQNTTAPESYEDSDLPI